MNYDYDVIVVGGGPAGAAAAKAAVKGGLKTLILEKKELPRHKCCAGFLLPTAHRYVEKYFGPTPDGVRAEPHVLKGSLFHLPGNLDFEYNIPMVSVWRNKFDSWLCRESGAEIWDSSPLTDFAEWKDRVEITCRHKGEEANLRARVLIAADGCFSVVAERIDPALYEGLPSFYSQVDYHRCDVDLDPERFHVFCDHAFGEYPCLYFKDYMLVTDSNVPLGEKYNPVRERWEKLLTDRYGFHSKERVLKMGCTEATPSVINRFSFGTDRVLVVGEAAGFINAGGEGMSSAIGTGYLAGEAAADSGGCAAAGSLYRESVKPERERTSSEFYLPSIMRGRSLPELKESLEPLSPLQAMRVIGRLFRWMSGSNPSPGRRKMIELAVRRILHGDFDFTA